MHNQKPLSGDLLDYGDWSTDGLVGLWLFNEGVGKVFDLSGNGNDGNLIADTHFVPGKFGSALDFDGTGDRVNITSLDMTSSRQLTISVWVRVVSSVAWGIIVAQADAFNQDNATGIILQGSSETPYILHSTDGGGRVHRAANTAIIDGKWRHLVGTINFDTTEIHFYTNGVLDDGVLSDSEFNENPETISADIGFGGSALWNKTINGQIDNVSIYNRALSASEIALLYREPFRMIRTKRRRIIYDGIEAALPTTFPYYYREIASRRIA